MESTLETAGDRPTGNFGSGRPGRLGLAAALGGGGGEL
jgi:hypothetical protein